ncbi:MAG: 50S ribosome-binding GTPase, partial [Alphaproteobacteria bacterium]|nr:50S ribosome-binding GTPase [Alphaproteobacteria bacterium]
LADAESTLALKDLMAAYGSTNLDCRDDFAAIDASRPDFYRFNTTIAGIDEADALLIIGSAEDAQEISLVENVQRLAMHPDDQFVAFQSLIDKGSTIEEVAARFGVTPNVVARRLKLAAVSPKLRTLYRKGGLTLDHMMAFAVSDDQAEQERIWKELPEWNRDPDDIRAALTGEALRGDHPVVRFVGMEAYVAAGGDVLRDLFDDENGGYVTDRVLLFRLAEEQLEGIAATVKAEGWKWAKAEVERDHSVNYRYVYPIEVDDEAEDETIKIAILGRPNVGKSTLVNALIGDDRMLTGPSQADARCRVDRVRVGRAPLPAVRYGRPAA